jgi:hypothetical protein
MRVPIVICPCGELVALLSVKHFTTMEVEDIDTCAVATPQLGAGSLQQARMLVRRQELLKCRDGFQQ